MAVKIFVGNLGYETDMIQLRELFEQYGVVTECDVLGGYGFVHMESEEVAREAIKALSGYTLNGSRINVEMSTASTQGRAKLAARATSATKIFVGNLAKSMTNEVLKELFETYGAVSEADILGGFGFVHMTNEQEAFKAIKSLNGYVLDGSRLNVELSTGGTQGKSRERERERDSFGGRASSYLPRSRVAPARYDPYPLPAPAARRTVDPYDSHGYSSSSSGRPGGDSFARDLLELYIKNRAAFDAYANDPMVRKSLNLPPVEADAMYARNPAPISLRDYDRRRLSDLPLSSSSSSIAADPYSSPSDFSGAYDALASGGGRAWHGSSYSGGGVDAGPQTSASARGRGHLYTSFE